MELEGVWCEQEPSAASAVPSLGLAYSRHSVVVGVNKYGLGPAQRAWESDRSEAGANLTPGPTECRARDRWGCPEHLQLL